MLKSAQYIMDNVIIADGVNSTKEYAKKAQVGVDTTIRKIYKVGSCGYVYTDKSVVAKYEEIPTEVVNGKEGWFLPEGTYQVILNEGVKLSKNETLFAIHRSSLNRSNVGVTGSVYDPGFTTESNGGKIEPISVKMTVANPYGFYVEKNARICQVLVAENEDTTLYDGQFQGGRIRSKFEETKI